MSRHNTYLIQDGIRTEKELCSIIVGMTNLLKAMDDKRAAELTKLNHVLGNDLDRYARIAELKIQIKQIREIKHELCEILKRSTNKMIVASIGLRGN